MEISSALYQQGALVLAGVACSMVVYFVMIKPRIEKRIERQTRDRKDQFVSLASHYLLTPISIIQTAVNQLQEGDSHLSADERRKLYDTVAVGQQRLWILAEQLVLVNEIDQNELRLNTEVGNLSDILTNAISSVDVFARNKAIKVNFHDNTREVQEARFDERRMKQALIAIIDNAIKFSGDGGEVEVRLNIDQNYCAIEIEDHGIGIPEAIINHLSDKFYRGTSLYNYDYEGMGLGLHVAYAIIKMHQGDIQFSSKSKKGTIVTVHIPTV